MNLKKDSKELTRSQEIALIFITNVVRDACSGSERPSAQELKKLAKDAGAALASGIKKFNEAI